MSRAALLKQIKLRVKNAHSGEWSASANIPFSGTPIRPRPSLSIDDPRGTQWHLDDVLLVIGARANLEALTVTIDEVLKYCEPHTDQMWSASIVSILLGCDFRDSKATLEKYFKPDQDSPDL